ncbi:MAG: hypothetical protein KGL42_16875 [Betaproteobacteria bacterium]|nr:hypothetical protein [Betaproteobacteria bacterium]
MLDVHILIHPATPRDWVTQCLDSVYEAADRAGFPVDVHQLPAVIGHIGQGRAQGYALGVQPYVTCVDDDDYVLPQAFAQMRDALEAGASAVCTPEQTLQNGYIRPGHTRHHLIAYRRGDIIDHTQWPCCGDVAQMNTIGPDAVDLAEPAYVHRLYMDSKARVMRRIRVAELELARG